MVTLRDFKTRDVGRLVDILNQPSVTQYLSTKIPNPYTREDAMWWVQEGSNQGFTRAVEYEGELVGCIGVNPGNFEYERSGEVGYWLCSSHWRKGIMREALRQIIALTFSNTNIERIFACVFSSNFASQKLLLDAGFSEEAILQRAIFKNGRFYGSHIFAILR
ncbi:GNAT family N-acetyltransferase [Alteromonas sp. S005]|uniref:GNAT family N-acetyltransferase n=1 Tax=Alteromonas sp. S005 TaxID=3117400 RepID=UPI002FE2A111